MASYDTIIAGGVIVDGTRVPRFAADLGITDGVITGIGRLRHGDARRVLDASGCIVAPGFIDLHTHYDAQLFWDPYCTLSGWHGVTSVVIGNCGFGFAPVAPELRERAMLTMTRVEAIPYDSMAAGLPWDWVSFPEFLDAVDRTPLAVNVQSYVPLAPLLTWVLGFERAKAGATPTDAELGELRRLLAEALDAGAGGFSAQRTPPTSGFNVQRDFDGTPMVTDVMGFEVLVAMAEVLGERNAGHIQLTNANGDTALDREQFETLARVSGRPVVQNVVVVFDHVPAAHRDAIAWLDSCRERGLTVYGQGVTTDAGFTFTFEDWNLFDERDAWREATTGTLSEKLAKFQDPELRARLRNEPPFVVVCPIPEIVVVGPRSPRTEPYRDRTIAEVAADRGIHPIDAMIDLAVADELRTGFFAKPTGARRDYLAELVSCPSVLAGVSDGGAHTKFATSGRYPTEFLTAYVRDLELMTLEDAHFKLSALPAHCAGFGDRGVLRVGAPADVVVYDFERLDSEPIEVVHDLPAGEWRRVQRARGYRYVLVNGEPTIVDDTPTHVHSGRLVRAAATGRNG